MKKSLSQLKIEFCLLALKQKKILVLVLVFSASHFHVTHSYGQLSSAVVSGQIRDDQGNATPGVNVVEKGTNNGSVSDADGRYTINVNNLDATLVFSFIGFATQEIPVNGRTTIDVSLSSDLKELTEVVVVGYGTQKRSSLIGSVASVSSRELNALPVPSMEQAIQGRVAGVIVTNNGAPGEAPLVRLRGISSINYASNPLYVVDGIVQVGNFQVFDSKDIESVEVLKDASASAIYGSRAAAGVLLITTRKGSNDGKVHVNLDSYVGVQSAWKKFNLLNTNQYVQYGTSLLTAAGQALPTTFSNMNSPIYAGSTQTFAQTNTDWQKEAFQNAGITQTQVTISSGTDKSKFYGSLGYFNQDGIMVGTGFKRFNARFNSEHKISNRVTFGETLLVANGFQKREPNAGGRTQVMNIIRMAPYITVLNPNNVGGYNGPTGADAQDAQNPVRAALQDLDQLNNTRVLGTLYLNVKITNWLTYRFNLGVDYNTSREYIYSPIYSEGFNSRSTGTLSDARSNYFSPIYTNQLTFDKTFGKHSFNATGVIEYQTIDIINGTGTGNSVSNAVQEFTGLLNQTYQGTRQDWSIFSYIGRLNYEYAGKYLLSASIRRDGTSNFGAGHKYGNFPSIGLGWRMSEENFIKNISAISELKLRASYGSMAFNNPNTLGFYPYVTVVAPNTTAVFGGGTQLGSFYNVLSSPNLTWETTNMGNVGIDLGLFNNKFTFSAEYYNRTTTNLILSVNPAASAGYTNGTIGNFGNMVNTGFDFQGSYRNDEHALKWGITGNIGFIHNTVKALYTATSSIEAGSNADFGGGNITRTEAGHPVQSFYGYKTNGIFQNASEVSEGATQPNAAPGDIRFVDIHKDGVIDANDRTYLGSFLPNFSYGLNFTANYKGFDFALFFQGVQGNKIYNGTKVIEQGMLRLFNSSTDVLRAWTPTNTNTDVPRAISGDPNNNARTSDRFVESGSYLRLKNISIGYSIPQDALQRATKNSLTKLRVYVTSTNLLTFTKYTGYDPEVGIRPNQASNLIQGIDYGQFPQARTFMVGLQVGF
jgi:TonB-linked SusC/RagA family outer membrane protein